MKGFTSNGTKATVLAALLVAAGASRLFCPSSQAGASGFCRAGFLASASPLTPIFATEEYMQRPSFEFRSWGGTTTRLDFQDLFPQLYSNRLAGVNLWHAVKFSASIPEGTLVRNLRESLCFDRFSLPATTDLRSLRFFRSPRDREGVYVECK